MRVTVVNLWFGTSKGLPDPENISQLEEGRVDEDGERVLLKQAWEPDHGLTLLSYFPRAQT